MVEYCIPTWKAIVEEQEANILFDGFDREKALHLGLKIIDLAGRKYERGVVVRIYMEGISVFQHSMQGCDLKNEWYLHGKLNTSVCYKMSSMRALLEYKDGAFEIDDKTAEGNSYLFCGGCVPVRLQDGSIIGYVIVSGLKHEEDHQLIIDAMGEFLNRELPSVL